MTRPITAFLRTICFGDATAADGEVGEQTKREAQLLHDNITDWVNRREALEDNHPDEGGELDYHQYDDQLNVLLEELPRILGLYF